MIDMHCHIINGIDDGSKTLETSIQMCRIAENNGIKHIVATPHISTLEDIDKFVSVRNEKLDILRRTVKEHNINLNFYAGAEVYVDDDIYFANNLKPLAINGSRYILVEFAFHGLKVKKIVDYLNEVLKMGLIPIVAHPERYEYFQYDYDAVNYLSDSGVNFQINATSLASLDGPEEFELAYSMAYNGIASFLSTDAHSPRYRTPALKEMMMRFPPDISQLNMQRMVHDSAKCVLTDTELPVMERRHIHKRGF